MKMTRLSPAKLFSPTAAHLVHGQVFVFALHHCLRRRGEKRKAPEAGRAAKSWVGSVTEVRYLLLL